MVDRYTLISADCHAGGNHSVRGYLETRYLDEFDAWRSRYSNPFSSLTSDTRERNWNSERRMAEQAEDGCVAESMFPNTIPPFFPTGTVIARAPTPEEYEASSRRNPGPQPMAGRLACGAAGATVQILDRFSSTTSTTPSPTSGGATTMGFGVGSCSSRFRRHEASGSSVLAVIRSIVGGGARRSASW